MLRAVMCLLLGLGFGVSARSAPDPGKKEPVGKGPSVEEIKKAVEELGSGRFAVRDKAKKFLGEAGAVAEPYLEEAAKSKDEETANSAKAILEKFQWGLYPDTAKEVRDLIEQFRTGMPEQRQDAIGKLMQQKPVPFATIRKLLAKEENPEQREVMFARLYEQVRTAIPELLARGDFDSAELLFELALTGSATFSAHDYAVFMFLRNKLDTAIARYEKERPRKGEPGQRAAEVLVYLYRVKGDWTAARKAAEDTKKDELVERVLFQAGDWKALANYSYKPEQGNTSGFMAAYERLAGNTKAFNEKIAEIKKAAEESMDDRATLRMDADALMLNGRANDAIKILTEKKTEMALTFDLLCAQMKHKEAFALVDEARRRDTNPMERDEIEVRRARMLAVLGDRDSAEQLFKKLVNEIRGRENFTLARSLIKTEARTSFRDLAFDHCGLILAALVKSGQVDSLNQLIEPLFGDNKDIALEWWKLFRIAKPEEDPIVAMKRVREMTNGKLDPKQFDEWIVRMEKSPPGPIIPRGGEVPPPIDPRLQAGNRNRGLDAIALAYRTRGDEKKAEEYLKKSAEKNNTYDRWLRLGDFLMAKKRYNEAAEAFAKSAKRANRDQEIEVDDDSIFFLGEQSPALPTYLQGRALVLGGDTTEGKRLIEAAHWMPLGNETVRANLIDELNKRDWPEMALKEANMLIKTGWYNHFSYGNVLSFLGRQAAKGKDYATAAAKYEKCVVGCLRTGATFIEATAYLVVPESIRVFRARDLLAKGKVDEAIKEAEANLDVMPGNIELAIKFVPELEKLGKKKEADAIYAKVRDAYGKLAKDYPNSAFAHNSIAWVMANCRRDLDDALKHSQKATELEPKTAGYLDTLAECHFRKGDREKALTLMKQCVELDAKNPYYKKQLARFKDQGFDSPTPDEGDEEEE